MKGPLKEKLSTILGGPGKLQSCINTLKLSNNPISPCGGGNQIVEHFLFGHESLGKERIVFQHSVQEEGCSGPIPKDSNYRSIKNHQCLQAFHLE